MPAIITGQTAPEAIAIADLDGDGMPDLAVADGDANAVSVYRGLGGGMFDTPTLYPAGPSPSDVAIADFDANGTLDLVVANGNAGPSVGFLFATCAD